MFGWGKKQATRGGTTEQDGRGQSWGGGFGGARGAVGAEGWAARGAVRASGVGSEKIGRWPAGEGKEQAAALLDLGSWARV